MTPYQTYIAKSRYSRYLDDKGRREHWPETVNRYFDFMEGHLRKKHNYLLPTELRKEP
jgi:ribonucleoside-triphosphate reductase